MARTPTDVIDAQLAVLQRLGDQGSAAIRELTDVLYPKGTNLTNQSGCWRVARGPQVGSAVSSWPLALVITDL